MGAFSITMPRTEWLAETKNTGRASARALTGLTGFLVVASALYKDTPKYFVSRLESNILGLSGILG